MQATTSKFVHNVPVKSNVVAIVEYATYDVWGNSRDGYEVNDAYRQGSTELPTDCHLSNVPRLPESDSGSSTVPVMISYTLSDRTIRGLFGIRCKLDVSGDDMTYYVNRARDNYPIGEITITGWKESD
jgi:hypothetical protein